MVKEIKIKGDTLEVSDDAYSLIDAIKNLTLAIEKIGRMR